LLRRGRGASGSSERARRCSYSKSDARAVRRRHVSPPPRSAHRRSEPARAGRLVFERVGLSTPGSRVGNGAAVCQAIGPLRPQAGVGCFWNCSQLTTAQPSVSGNFESVEHDSDGCSRGARDESVKAPRSSAPGPVSPGYDGMNDGMFRTRPAPDTKRTSTIAPTGDGGCADPVEGRHRSRSSPIRHISGGGAGWLQA